MSCNRAVVRSYYPFPPGCTLRYVVGAKSSAYCRAILRHRPSDYHAWRHLSPVIVRAIQLLIHHSATHASWSTFCRTFQPPSQASPIVLSIRHVDYSHYPPIVAAFYISTSFADAKTYRIIRHRHLLDVLSPFISTVLVFSHPTLALISSSRSVSAAHSVPHVRLPPPVIQSWPCLVRFSTREIQYSDNGKSG